MSIRADRDSRARRWRVGALLGALLAAAPAVCGAQEQLVADGTFHTMRKRQRIELCQSSWEIRDDGQFSVFTERGRGACHGFSEPVSWESETRVLSADPRQLRETFRKIRSLDGATLLKTSVRTFDPATGTVMASIVEPVDKGRTREAHWDGLPDVATPTSLLFVVQHGLAHGRRSGSIKLVTSEPALYTMRWVDRGVEKVTIPVGTFTCVKIELLVDLGLLSVFRPLLPKLFIWYTVDAPYYWIRYEGLEDGVHSPKVIIERTSPAVPPDRSTAAP